MSRRLWCKTLAAWLLVAAIAVGLPRHEPWWRVDVVSLLVYAAVMMLP